MNVDLKAAGTHLTSSRTYSMCQSPR